jgi:hypothetical protein
MMPYAIVVIVGFALLIVIEVLRRVKLTPDQLDEEERRGWGALNPVLVCPHCQSRGAVRTKPVVQKKGISGAKATGAILTSGISLLATGLSRKEAATEAHCERCGSTWHF